MLGYPRMLRVKCLNTLTARAGTNYRGFCQLRKNKHPCSQNQHKTNLTWGFGYLQQLKLGGLGVMLKSDIILLYLIVITKHVQLKCNYWLSQSKLITRQITFIFPFNEKVGESGVKIIIWDSYQFLSLIFLQILVLTMDVPTFYLLILKRFSRKILF